MIYAYVQTAKGGGDLQIQQSAVEAFACARGLSIDRFLNGEKELSENVFAPGDLLLVESWTRFGADVVPVIAAMKELLSRGVVLYSCADSLSLGGDMATPVLINVFDLVSRIATQTRSARTKEGLRKSRQAGKTLGRKAGSRNKNSRLDGKEAEIAALLASGVGKNKIAKRMRVDYYSLIRFLDERKDVFNSENSMDGGLR